MNKEISTVVMIHGGGTGPLEVEKAFLRCPTNVISGTGIADDGGDTGRYRMALDIPGIGDATRRMSIHVEDSLNQEPFIFRWEGDHGLRFQRPVNGLLALFIDLEGGSLSRGIRRMEKFIQGYTGRVVALSDDKVHLKITYTDGSVQIGEHHIDEMRPDHSPIAKVEYYPNLPRVNDEYLYAARNADVNVVAPGTWHGSIEPLLLPEVVEAIQKDREESGAITVWVCNAFTKPETHGWTASRFAKRLHQLGLGIDIAFLNIFNHPIPESYAKEDTYPVLVNKQEIAKCREYANEVLPLNLTSLDIHREQPHLMPDGSIEYGVEKQVVRHTGKPIAEIVMERLERTNIWVARRNQFMNHFFNGC